jgi:hypothetical protein
MRQKLGRLTHDLKVARQNLQQAQVDAKAQRDDWLKSRSLMIGMANKRDATIMGGVTLRSLDMLNKRDAPIRRMLSSRHHWLLFFSLLNFLSSAIQSS